MRTAMLVQFLVLLMGLFHRSTPVRAEGGATGPRPEPEWRIEARAFGEGPAATVGLHRRVGGASSLGLLMSGHFTGQDVSTNFTTSATEQEHLSDTGAHASGITLGLEWRRRAGLTPVTSWHWGLLVSGSYADQRSAYASAAMLSGGYLGIGRSRTRSWNRTFASALTLGAEWAVTPHLALGASFRPVRLSYGSRTQVERLVSRDDDPPRPDIQRASSSAWETGISAAPTLNAILRF